MENNDLVSDLVRKADLLRDASRWEEAAEFYRQALFFLPKDAPLLVQLGNMLKEGGDLEGAKASYKKALGLDPHCADIYVQLGHALKLGGQPKDAIVQYLNALKLDRQNEAAIEELIGSTNAWLVESETGLGRRALGSVFESLTYLKKLVDQIESALPEISSLTSLPSSSYELFRRSYRPLPPADTIGARFWSVVVIADVVDVLPCLRSIAHSSISPCDLTLLSSETITETLIKTYEWGGLKCPCRLLNSIDVLNRILKESLSSGKSVLLVLGSVLVDPSILSWLNWAFIESGSEIIYVDEEIGERDTTPILKSAFDPEGSSALFSHGLLALSGRSDAKADFPASAPPFSGSLLQSFSESYGAKQAHLPRILARRSRALPVYERRSILDFEPLSGAITVIIPTRDGGPGLHKCLDQLFELASDADKVSVIIVDNGPDNLDRFKEMSERIANGRVNLLRDADEFNFSRICNKGAFASSAEILLFMNDDVELMSPNWDQILRRHLGRSEVGAVGARLLYPDGSLQHAGIVLGPNGRAEHEGIAPIGITADIAARWKTRRRVAAVTGAFLACRPQVFSNVGGFDSSIFPIWFNDIDFCLKIRKLGLQIIYEPMIEGLHYESRTLEVGAEDPKRSEIWKESLAAMHLRWGDWLSFDPSFNPHFSRIGRPFEALNEPSLSAVRTHLKRSGMRPWLID